MSTMTKALEKRFRAARIDPSTAIFVDRRALTEDPTLITCDGWLVPAANPTERVGGVIVYIDTDDKQTYWHRYYCGEERNPNRFKLGNGLVGWVVDSECVERLKQDAARWAERQEVTPS